MRPLGYCALAAVVAMSAGAAWAQRGGRADFPAAALAPAGPRATLPERPAGPEAQNWIAREVQAADGWRIVRRDEAGAVLTKLPGPVSSTGALEIEARLEYRQPQLIDGDLIRSVRATLRTDCAAMSVRGDVYGYEGQNLTGPRHSAAPADLDRPTKEGRERADRAQSQALKLLTPATLRESCMEANRRVAERFGPEWRGLAVDGRATRLVTAGEGYDPLQVAFRVEAVLPQRDEGFRWRSAVARTRISCPTGTLTADVTYAGGANQSGETKSAAYMVRRGRSGVDLKVAGGDWKPLRPPGDGAPEEPGAALIALLRGGAAIFDECDTAKSRITVALATPGAPERLRAESWMGQNLNIKGWRMPAFVPEGVTLLSDEVADTQSGARRALVRTEYIQPIAVSDDRRMASRITVVEFDCAQKKFRGVGENLFARNGAREPLVQAPTPQAPWRAFEEDAAMSGYAGAVCATQTAG